MRHIFLFKHFFIVHRLQWLRIKNGSTFLRKMLTQIKDKIYQKLIIEGLRYKIIECLIRSPFNKIYEALFRDLLEFPLVLHPVVQLGEKNKDFHKKYNIGMQLQNIIKCVPYSKFEFINVKDRRFVFVLSSLRLLSELGRNIWKDPMPFPPSPIKDDSKKMLASSMTTFSPRKQWCSLRQRF